MAQDYAKAAADEAVKHAFVKFTGGGGTRPGEGVSIRPGTKTSELLSDLGCGGGGFVLKDPNRPEVRFPPSDNLYAKISDGDVLCISAEADAGRGDLA